jgi:phage shock protein C
MTEEKKFKRLYRSKNDKMIGGVCGGFGEYLGMDAIIIRIIWVISLFLGGVGFILYLAALIMIPENPDEKSSETQGRKKTDKNVLLGTLLIILGSFFLLRQFGIMPHINFWSLPWQSFWALALIILGVLLIFNFAPGNKEKNGDLFPGLKNGNQIYRSKTERKVAGVCAGLAHYFCVDANLIRLGFVLLTIVSAGLGLLVYIIMVIVFPEENASIQKGDI